MQRRHWMLTPNRNAWAGLLARRPDLASEPLVAAWAERGFPLVLRRPLEDEPPGEVPLGLPLPPGLGKRRLALTLPERDIVSIQPPPRLAAAAATAPAAWQGTIAALLRLDAGTRCFGSLAWHYLTGLSYLSPASDLDLLWELPAQPSSLLDGIAAIAGAAPMQIDGEVQGSSGAAQWRELHASCDHVAVKNDTAVVLMAKGAFLACAPS
ncbi:malonate decarboxylase holo-[acyl-carrier-protein] synthase [Acidisoma silvae]|uniref:Malonate decarboxylase holo-[acyl-carrier-protein] synthase n=1 Tax=Acidisoma silvae TaxID=2802396 RepID=A0A964E0A0_9PROT|nr:malonate decarboxylase holo-[acyl-carrier-protein] synthase [Acidisoma silvae]MCB8877126.1 malonate decarboxylase holo-[acyl-carrier-protein] synthase [Acidisoma silvae]